MSVNGDQSRKDHQECRQTGWDIVGNVVDMGSPAAEVFIALRLIADHRVKGVHHLIGQHAWDAKDGEPEEGSNDTVAQVLGKGFEGSSTYLLG